MISHKDLTENLLYCKESGVFTWKKTLSNRGKKGNIAGHINNKDGYIRIKILNKVYLAHRLAWLYEYGVNPTNHIDHIDHVKSNNSILNLRDVSALVNCQNQGFRSDNKSGHIGIGWHKGTSKWRARITVDKKEINLGLFAKYSEAVDARKNAEVLYGFHKNHGRK